VLESSLVGGALPFGEVLLRLGMAALFGMVIGTQTIEERYETTPDIFLSFHDTGRFPSVRSALARTRGPVFWSTGRQDPVPTSKRRSFEMIPADPASRYLEPEGDHNSSMLTALDSILQWLAAR